MAEQSVTVEFFGVPRRRAGVTNVKLPLSEPMSLAALLGQLSERFPELAEECFEQSTLRTGYIANLDGACFLVDSKQLIEPGQNLLIMSSDAGG